MGHPAPTREPKRREGPLECVGRAFLATLIVSAPLWLMALAAWVIAVWWH